MASMRPRLFGSWPSLCLQSEHKRKIYTKRQRKKFTHGSVLYFGSDLKHILHTHTRTHTQTQAQSSRTGAQMLRVVTEMRGMFWKGEESALSRKTDGK